MATYLLSSLITRCGVTQANKIFLQPLRPSLWTVKASRSTTEVDTAKIPKMSKQRKELAEKILERTPHRPPSSFLIFYKERRLEVAKKHPGKKMTEISQIMGSLWRNLPQKDKAYYKDLSEPLKERYHREMEKFKRSLTEKDKVLLEDYMVEKHREKDQREHKKAIKESNKPKKPITGYRLFIQLQKDKIPKGEDGTKFMSKLSGMWDKLSESEKKRFNDEAAKELPQYEKEMSSWVQSMVLTGMFDLVTKAEVKRELDRLGKPKGRVSAINMFTLEHREQYGSVIAAAKEFHFLSDEKKAMYKKKAEEVNKQHAKAHEKWLEQMNTKGHKGFVELAEKYLASRKAMTSSDREGKDKKK